jgi:hypothetical protein
LTQAYANFEAAEQEAQRLKSDILPAARLALDAMSRGYELGKFSFLDVLDAQRTLFQGQSYVRALAGAHAARADIGRLVGTPLAAVAQQRASYWRIIMSRSRIFVIAAAVLGGAGIVIGALAVTRRQRRVGADRRRNRAADRRRRRRRAAVSCSSAASCRSRS